MSSPVNKIRLKRELKKFLISFVFTNIYLIYYNSDMFRDSLSDAVTNIFSYSDYITVLLAVAVYITGYLIFNLFYLIIRYIFKKRKLSPVKVTVIVISVIFVVVFLNDRLILNDTGGYPAIRGYFSPEDAADRKIDPTNFNEYSWIRESIEMYDGEYLEKERLIFTSDNSFRLNGSRIKIDRLYLFRKLFNSIETYEIKGGYVYKNVMFVIDSLHHTYSIQLRKNRLYLNSIVAEEM